MKRTYEQLLEQRGRWGVTTNPGLGLLPLQIDEAVRINSTIGLSIFGVMRTGDGATGVSHLVAVFGAQGGSAILSGELYQSYRVTPSTAAVTVELLHIEAAEAVGDVQSGSIASSQQGTWSVSIVTPAIVDSQAFDGSIAAATADAVSQAGANALPLGGLVTFRLSAEGNLVTAGDIATYVDLVGATSTTVYAKLYAGAGAAMAGSIRMPTSEKLDVHTANQDTVAHRFTASWECATGI